MMAMKKYVLVIFMIFVVGLKISYGQKYFVEHSEIGFEQPVIDKLVASGFVVIFKQDSADYLVKCVISKAGFATARGYVAIIDLRTGKQIWRTSEAKGSTNAFNGYANARTNVMQRVADRYLIDAVKNSLKAEVR